jgi:hypothetical protein
MENDHDGTSSTQPTFSAKQNPADSGVAFLDTVLLAALFDSGHGMGLLG